MYFKITNKKSEAYKAVDGFMKNLTEIRRSNAKKLQEFSGIKFSKYSSYDSIFELCGTIASIIPSDKNFAMPNDWIEDKKARVAGAIKPNHKTSTGKATLKFMKELPNKTLWDMHKVFKYKSNELNHPGIMYGVKGVILVEFSEKQKKVKPLPGMVEIKTSEYYKLQGK